MIYIDASQMFISNAMVYLSYNDELDENKYKFMIYSTLLSYMKNKRKYGDMILCFDSKKNWRRSVFEYYKASRRKSRKEETKIDWAAIFKVIDATKLDLSENFPFKCIEVENAEADDVIGILSKHIQDKSLIISSDKDYFQLQKYNWISQYSPITKKQVKPDGSPSNYLREHIIRGDKGDGIPNFLSADNIFVEGGRQAPITKKKLDSWFGKDPKEFCDDIMLRNFQRNELLIDFDRIPKEIENTILENYANSVIHKKSKLLNYFIENRFKEFISKIDNF
jgi:hypothetical protein